MTTSKLYQNTKADVHNITKTAENTIELGCMWHVDESHCS